MKWTLEKLDKLEEQIEQLHQTTELSENTLADVMGKIDTERFKINQANGVITGDELVLPIQNVSNCKTIRYSEGDDVIVKDCINGHGFEIGEEITILEVREEDYHAKSDTADWYIQDSEIESVE